MTPSITTDPASLGRILLLQSTLQASPDEAQLADMLSGEFTRLPGVRRCVICIEGRMVSSGNNSLNPLPNCLEWIAETGEPFVGCPPNCPHQSEMGTPRFIFHTCKRDYGAIFLEIADETAFAPYAPFVANTANLVALHIENTRRGQALEAANRELDQKVTERTQALHQSEERLSEINTCLLSLGADYDANVSRLTELCGRLLGATCALYNRLDGGLLRTMGAWNTPPDLPATDLPDGHICYDVIRSGKRETVVINHLDQTPYFQTDPGVARYGLKTYAGHPVLCHHQSVGTICVVFQEDVSPEEDALRVLSIIASALGVEERRRQAEVDLRREKERLRNILEGTNVGTWEWNVQTGETLYNDLWTEMIGYTLEELSPTSFDTWIELVHPDDLIGSNTMLEQHFRGERPFYEIECRLKHKAGHWIWVLARGKVISWTEDGKPLWMYGTHQDITQRKEAEEHLQRFKTIFDSANYGCAIADLDGKLEYINTHLATIHGYDPDELIGKHLSVFHNAEQMQEVTKVNKGLFEKGTFGPLELWHIHKEGAPFPMLMTGLLIKDNNGRPTHMAVAAIDLTREVELENQLRQAQKMEVVGQLAGGVAHDFNNLLQVILGYGDVVLSQEASNKLIHESIQEMVNAGERAAALVRQLLAFSRRQVLTLCEINLNEVVHDMLKMLKRLIGEHITLKFLEGANLASVRADAGQIGQILVNLCVNARDAMQEQESGTITIETENVFISKSYCANHLWAKPGRHVVMRVTDTGCGMDEAIQEKVFEPFFTTKEVGKGSGLGLSTVYGLIDQHKGFVHIHSEVDHGTAVAIYLPVCEAPESAPASSPTESLPEGNETILLSEDDDSVRKLTRAFLERAGYSVLTAANGEEALAVLEKRSADIDMAILDVVMPRGGGRTIYEQIKTHYPHIRVLFASGYSMNAVHTGFVLEEGMMFIQKPAARGDLLQKVRAILDGVVE